MPAAIRALAIGAFAICTGEFIIMGLLQEIANDLNTTLGQSGFLVSGYALGVVLGAPLLTPLLIGLNRKPVLIGLMLVFTLGNILCVLAPNYSTLVWARLFTALSQASFFGLGAVVAIKLVPVNKQASAIAAMFLGATLANIFGSPIGALIGQAFGWRITFIVIACFGGIAMLSIAKFVPEIQREQTTNLGTEFKTLIQPRTIRALLITMFGFGGSFAAFTYIAPMLSSLTGVEDEFIPLILLICGLGMALGNPLGAMLSGHNAIIGVRIALGALVLSLVVLHFSVYSTVAMIVDCLLFGVAMFATIPTLQTYVLSEAKNAPVLASTFNIAAFNLGNAGGAWLGGAAIDTGTHLSQLPLIAAVICTIGFILSATVSQQMLTAKGKLIS